MFHHLIALIQYLSLSLSLFQWRWRSVWYLMTLKFLSIIYLQSYSRPSFSLLALAISADVHRSAGLGLSSPRTLHCGPPYYRLSGLEVWQPLFFKTKTKYMYRTSISYKYLGFILLRFLVSFRFCVNYNQGF